MDKKRMKQFEKFLQDKFPECSIHVRPDSKHEFVISGDDIGNRKEEVWATAEQFLGPTDWGKPHYGDA